MAAQKKATTKTDAQQKRSSAKKRSATKTRSKRPAKKVAAKKTSKLSALDAAVRVLAEARQPMNCREMIEAMAAAGYWTSPAGKTPSATLYSGILRELETKGDQARFRKVDRGRFDLTKTVR